MTERPRQFSTWRGALRQLVADIGGAEAMSRAMWPKRDAEKGAKLINSWLDARRREKPDLEDVEAMLRAGRIRGLHDAFHDLCDRLYYTRGQAVAPEKELELLRDEIDAHHTAITEKSERWKRLRFELDVLNGGGRPLGRGK
jgi:hypothetical protein